MQKCFHFFKYSPYSRYKRTRYKRKLTINANFNGARRKMYRAQCLETHYKRTRYKSISHYKRRIFGPEWSITRVNISRYKRIRLKKCKYK